mmetsp:Transcript_13715/g.29214  ORF Transcript_13715/g.29214 Transcript_13715/m.29214 type:complete len:218 (+) Transcript_13715:386-1039(+)
MQNRGQDRRLPLPRQVLRLRNHLAGFHQASSRRFQHHGNQQQERFQQVKTSQPQPNPTSSPTVELSMEDARRVRQHNNSLKSLRRLRREIAEASSGQVMSRGTALNEAWEVLVSRPPQRQLLRVPVATELLLTSSANEWKPGGRCRCRWNMTQLRARIRLHDTAVAEVKAEMLHVKSGRLIPIILIRPRRLNVGAAVLELMMPASIATAPEAPFFPT